MRKLLLSLGLLLCFAFSAKATHQRAAEITYTWLGGNAYEFTLTCYTYSPSPAGLQRDSLYVKWGDGMGDYIPRVVLQNLGDDYTLNVYKAVHNYSSSGTYTISMEDANRNYGVVNVPNSVNVPMYIETELVINPFLGYNNSVQLLNAPVDKGCVGKLYLHNPSAYDPDGDSLSYKLVTCKGVDGMDIPGYNFPQASHSFEIDAVTGDLRWENPLLQGEYNVAFMVEEWRHGVKIGSVIRDMQILVSACNNDLPQIHCDDEFCVVASEQLNFTISASDPNPYNDVTLTASGAPFEVAVGPAILNPETSTAPNPELEFIWNTTYAHIRNTPYLVVIHAKDNGTPVSLTNVKTVTINVMAPKVQNLTAEVHGHDATLSWTAYPCQNAASLLVYRRAGCNGYLPDACETGIRDGFQLLATLNNTATSYVDANLPQGVEYEYRIVAKFPDGALSIVSDAACVALPNTSPLITHVSNDSIDLVSGQVVTRWVKPKEIDDQYVAPFSYTLSRILNGETSVVYEGADTTFLDANVDLADATSLIYKVQMRDANQQLMGESAMASAVMLSANGNNNEAHLSWTEAVPWMVDSTLVFKEVNNHFVRIAATNGWNYTDSDMESDATYRYYVCTYGHYTVEGIMRPLVNYSAIKSVRIGHEEPTEEFSYKLPNVFTPNDDGYNDVFEPVVTGIDLIINAKTVIFNRWGNILWDTDDPLIQWDGKNKNTKLDCPPGTYFYVTDITYQGETGEEKLHLQGSITIVK